MPIYEFRCLECGNLFERLFLNPDKKMDVKCPACHSVSFERVISKANYKIGLGKEKGAKATVKSCGAGNSCMSFEIPGPD